MIAIINESCDPYFNMAVEEHLIKNMSGSNIFMLWQNRPTVVVGRNQNTIEEINPTYIEEAGISVVRRLSGGGAVYHDQGNLNFTFVTDNSRDFANFQKFTRPVIRALGRLGIEAKDNGRNDISIAGRKFSGNAQFQHKDRLLHHGTILFDTNIAEMVKALNPSGAKISSKGIKSVRSRVTNICEHLASPVPLAKFKQVLTEEVLREDPHNESCALNPDDLLIINRLRTEKYLTWAWIYGTSPPYNLRKTGSLSWGNIDIRLEVKRGLISSCRIFGDYFALGDIKALEKFLTGSVYREAEVKTLLQAFDLTRILPDSNAEEFLDLLFR